jgi:hypothetical protein
MKKFVAGTVAVFAMSAGLVATAGSAAHADPYPGTFATTTKAKVPTTVRAGKVALCAKVKVKGSNLTPTGTITFSIDQIGGSYSKTKTVSYAGGKTCITKRLRPGAYVLRAAFSSPAPVLNDSSGSKGFRVIKRGR